MPHVATHLLLQVSAFKEGVDKLKRHERRGSMELYDKGHPKNRLERERERERERLRARKRSG